MEEFTLYTLDEVDIAFEKITQLKYNQSVREKINNNKVFKKINYLILIF